MLSLNGSHSLVYVFQRLNFARLYNMFDLLLAWYSIADRIELLNFIVLV